MRPEHNTSLLTRQKITRIYHEEIVANQLSKNKIYEKISAKCNCSVSTVRRMISRWQKDESLEDKPRSGRPRVLTDEEVHAVIAGLQVKAFTTLDIMIEDYTLDCHPQTLADHLHKQHVRRVKATRKPLLTDAHIAYRLEWSKKMLTWPSERLRKIIYTDEKTFYSNLPLLFFGAKLERNFQNIGFIPIKLQNIKLICLVPSVLLEC